MYQAVNSVCTLANGRIVSGSDDKTVRVWNADTGECDRVLEGHSNVRCAVYDDTDRYSS